MNITDEYLNYVNNELKINLELINDQERKNDYIPEKV